MNNNVKYNSFNQFIFRSPALSFQDLKSLENLDALLEQLSDIHVQESIYLASPILYRELQKLLKNEIKNKIGMEGNGISQGQRQRLLIARAVYKNPEFLFFDEATNALDANNERIIMDNLNEFYKGKTVVVVAHRLSTVQNADNIIVLDKGKIVEEGTHKELTALKGAYYTLVKNQLELGS